MLPQAEEVLGSGGGLDSREREKAHKSEPVCVQGWGYPGRAGRPGGRGEGVWEKGALGEEGWGEQGGRAVMASTVVGRVCWNV